MNSPSTNSQSDWGLASDSVYSSVQYFPLCCCIHLSCTICLSPLLVLLVLVSRGCVYWQSFSAFAVQYLTALLKPSIFQLHFFLFRIVFWSVFHKSPTAHLIPSWTAGAGASQLVFSFCENWLKRQLKRWGESLVGRTPVTWWRPSSVCLVQAPGSVGRSFRWCVICFIVFVYKHRYKMVLKGNLLPSRQFLRCNDQWHHSTSCWPVRGKKVAQQKY